MRPNQNPDVGHEVRRKTASPGRLLDALDAFDQRRPGALLSSDDYGLSVEPTATLHQLWQALCRGKSSEREAAW